MKSSKREIDIIRTLLTKIKEKNQTFLTASLVREMKELFPELSSERVFALFMWTIWMHERSNKSRSEENPLVSVVQVERENSVAVACRNEESVSPRRIVTSDGGLDASWDPMLTTASRSPMELNSPQAIQAPAMAEGEETGSSVEHSVGCVGSGMADMFPELYNTDEEEFDFGN